MVFSRGSTQKVTANEFSLTIETLNFRIAQLAKSQVVDEIDDLLQRCLDSTPVATDHTEAQNRALPKLLTAALGHRNIELIGDPSLNRFEDAALSLQ